MKKLRGSANSEKREVRRKSKEFKAPDRVFLKVFEGPDSGPLIVILIATKAMRQYRKMIRKSHSPAGTQP